jgi:hypothetical protein
MRVTGPAPEDPLWPRRGPAYTDCRSSNFASATNAWRPIVGAAMMAVHPCKRNATRFTKAPALHDFYFGDGQASKPLGSPQLLGKLREPMLRSRLPRPLALVEGARHRCRDRGRARDARLRPRAHRSLGRGRGADAGRGSCARRARNAVRIQPGVTSVSVRLVAVVPSGRPDSEWMGTTPKTGNLRGRTRVPDSARLSARPSTNAPRMPRSAGSPG